MGMDEAEDAIRELDHSRVFGGPMLVSFAPVAPPAPRRASVELKANTTEPARSRSPAGRGRQTAARQSRAAVRVIVGNLPSDMDYEEFSYFVKAYGKILHCDVRYDKRDNINVGTVEFSNADEADNAIRELDGRAMSGWDKRL